MKSIFKLFFVILILCKNAYSQKKSDTLRLFYGINESFSKKNNTILDSLINIFGIGNCDVAIYGYADFLSSDAYNNSLSELRSQNVKKYILEHDPKKRMNIKVCNGYGEKFSVSNGHAKGEPYFRRVDVVFQKEKFSEDTLIEKKNLSELKVGESLVLEGLMFKPGQHYLMEKSVAALQKLLKALKDLPNLKIQIRGHVCCVSNDSDGLDMETNEWNLSENRAKAINDYLVSQGIDESRLTYIGLGHKEPLYPNEYTSEEQQANRRVEIRVLSR